MFVSVIQGFLRISFVLCGLIVLGANPALANNPFSKNPAQMSPVKQANPFAPTNSQMSNAPSGFDIASEIVRECHDAGVQANVNCHEAQQTAISRASLHRVKAEAAAESAGMFGKCGVAKKAGDNMTADNKLTANICIDLQNSLMGATTKTEEGESRDDSGPCGPEAAARLEKNLQASLNANTITEAQAKKFVADFQAARDGSLKELEVKIIGMHSEIVNATIYSGKTFGLCRKLKASSNWIGDNKGKLLVGGAVVGGIMYKNKRKKDKKKDREKAQQQILDREEEGYFMVDGKEMNCNDFSNSKEEACGPYVMEMCAGDKKNFSNCLAFDRAYCADQNTDVSKRSYCLYAESKNYCRQNANAQAAAPACQWVASRDGKMCAADPTSVMCLSPMQPGALDVACNNHAYDPLCSAHKAGMIVSQPNPGDPENVPVPDDTPPGDVIVGQPVPPTPNTGRGGVVTTTGLYRQNNMAAANGPSLYNSSSSALRTLCQGGRVYDCAAGRYPASQ